MSTPKTAFSENDLGGLEWVLHAVCSALNSAKISLDEAEKTSLRRRLFLLACNGMNDPEILRGHLIDSFTRLKTEGEPHEPTTPAAA